MKAKLKNIVYSELKYPKNDNIEMPNLNNIIIPKSIPDYVKILHINDISQKLSNFIGKNVHTVVIGYDVSDETIKYVDEFINRNNIRILIDYSEINRFKNYENVYIFDIDSEDICEKCLNNFSCTCKIVDMQADMENMLIKHNIDYYINFSTWFAIENAKKYSTRYRHIFGAKLVKNCNKYNNEINEIKLENIKLNKKIDELIDIIGMTRKQLQLPCIEPDTDFM